MRRLYGWLLRLYPARVRQEFGAEMLAVFEEASAAARPAGFIAYISFCLKEVAGLLMNVSRAAVTEEVRVSRRKWITICGAIGLAAALAYALNWAWTPYTSKALLVLHPAQIPARYAPATEVDLNFRLHSIFIAATSRGHLTNVINTLNLYPGDRMRMPMEDVIERMRPSLRVKQAEGRVDISFTYSDRIQAQKVTQYFVSAAVNEYVRIRASAAIQTVEFLSERRGQVGKEWEAAIQELKVAAQRGATLDRLQLEVAIARKNYEELSAQLAEAETSKSLEERKQGPLLEMLDPASLPRPGPEWWDIALLALAGGLAGMALGWLLARLFSAALRAPKPSFS